MSETRPNVVLCVCDQLRAFDVGCYGHPVVQTPHLNGLAARGVRFPTAITNNPLCSPARSCLLSGQHSRTCNGATGNCGDPELQRRNMPGTSLAEAFRDADYRTASIGKWHMASRPDSVGFEHWVYPTFQHRHRGRRYFDAARPDGYEVEGWTWDYDFRRLQRFLDGGDERPFFVYYNIEPPHMPLDDAPDRYRRMYDPGTTPLRDNAMVDGAPARDEHWFRIYLWDYLYYRDHVPFTEALPDGFDLRRLAAMYLGMVTLVDDLVGRMMADLESRGLADNTIILFTSDHGDNLGSHGHFNKARFWEESVRVPLIVAAPELAGGLAPAHQLASLVDVMPTLLGLTGVPVPEGLHGVDLTPVLRGRETPVGENAAFIEAPQDGIAVRTPTHLYGMALDDMSTAEHRPENDRIADERLAFYDLRSDPLQQRNLASTDEQSDTADGLRRRLKRWHRETPWASP
jgi:arylsulfatase A-like enzyme